jgi:N-acetylglucosamine-6-phosphate deacetylase
MIWQTENDKELIARDCLNGNIIRWKSANTIVASGTSITGDTENLPFAGPGLIDLQINGVNGIDFNDISLSEQGLLFAAEYLLSKGITTFFPTVITNSAGNILKILSVIDKACTNHPILDQCIGGIHLEGPFISLSDGYRGAHSKKYVTAPDWDLFTDFQKAAGNRIRIISLSPEWENSVDFIRKCHSAGLIVGIAHSRADSDQVEAAVNAGASLSTHLGNSVPLMLPRHPNIIWDQLAEDRLYASIVADGFHLPDSFIQVVLRTKREKAILVSDTTYFSGMQPGVYKSHIGKEVVLEEGGRLSMKGHDGLLAGAARLLTDNIEYMIGKKLASLSTAWHMASAGPGLLIGYEKLNLAADNYRDLVVFNVANGRIVISRVIKQGVTVWKQE